MYRQIDGVAIGSPLGPALANIFVGHYKSYLFGRVKKPPMYYRYLDDTFAIFDSKNDCDEFLHIYTPFPLLCSLRLKKKLINLFLFLMYIMKKVGSNLITSV